MTGYKEVILKEGKWVGRYFNDNQTRFTSSHEDPRMAALEGEQLRVVYGIPAANKNLRREAERIIQSSGINKQVSYFLEPEVILGV